MAGEKIIGYTGGTPAMVLLTPVMALRYYLNKTIDFLEILESDKNNNVYNPSG
jgi:hypothetical protein